MIRTHPPLLAIQSTRQSSMISTIPSTSPCKYSGWPWQTQSTARPPATENMETTFPQVMSDLKRSWPMAERSVAAALSEPRMPPGERLAWRATFVYSLGYILSSSVPAHIRLGNTSLTTMALEEPTMLRSLYKPVRTKEMIWTGAHNASFVKILHKWSE